MQMIRNTWGTRLRQVFAEIPDPTWRDAPATAQAPRLETTACTPVRATPPAGLETDSRNDPSPVQLVAQRS
jgi:putative proteasome-type protease